MPTRSMPKGPAGALPLSQIQHFTATEHYTLGYTRPNNEDLGFDKANGAAYIIQSRFRVRKRRQEWLNARSKSEQGLSSSTLNSIVSQTNRRRRHEDPVAPPKPTTVRGKMWALFNDPSSSIAACKFASNLVLAVISSSFLTDCL
jgi:hypothetical protein